MFVDGYGIIGFDEGDILRDKKSGETAKLVQAGTPYSVLEYLTGDHATCRETPIWHYRTDYLDSDFELVESAGEKQ